MRTVSLLSQEMLNDLVSFTFKQNSVADNAVYFLEHQHYENIARIVHSTYAHLFGGLADRITDFAKNEGVRIYRKGFEGDTEDFEDLEAVFIKLLEKFEEYQDLVFRCIEVAENNGDINVKTFLEEYSLNLGIYNRQLHVWLARVASHEYQVSLEANFSKFTFIPEND